MNDLYSKLNGHHIEDPVERADAFFNMHLCGNMIPWDTTRTASMRRALAENFRAIKGILDWQPISSAPIAKNLLLWWTPKTPNPHAEALITGAIPADRACSIPVPVYWDLKEGKYYPLARITHWAHIPLGPQERRQ